MFDDYVIAASAGVMVATAVILAGLLVRYRRLVEEADKSSRLAKDIWDSVNSRFSVVDTRIIDLMAKTDVLTSRATSVEVGVSRAPAANPGARPEPPIGSKPLEAARVVTVAPVAMAEGTDIDGKILRLLADGPKSSARIKEEIGRSREHTARLMKALYDRGLVVRNDRHKPYVYEITDSGRSYVAS